MPEINMTEALGELANDPVFEGRVPSDIPTLAKRVIDSQAEISRRVPVPGADASDEQKAKFYERLQTAAPDLVRLPNGDDEAAGAFWNKLGRPESPDGYKVEADDDAVKAEKQAIASKYAKKAHALGLNTRQFAGLVDDIYDSKADQIKTVHNNAKTATETLQKKWGDAYGDKLAHARMAAAHYGMTDLLEANPEYGNSTPLLELLAEQGAGLAEDESIATVMRVGAGMATPAELVARRNEIMSNKDHPYNKRGKGHTEAVEEMKSLNARIVAARNA